MSNTNSLRTEETANIEALQGKLDAAWHLGRLSLDGYTEMTRDLQLRKERIRKAA